METKSTGMVAVSKSGEMSASAVASKAKALVEAKYTIALHRPRSILDARAAILDACKRPNFAKGALYSKPVGGKRMEGLSIRFAETAIQSMRNIDVSTVTIFEDDEKRTVNISVTDLEANTGYSKDVTIAKTVERKFLKDGQTPISKRQNSQGDWTYLLPATEDEIANKVAAAESKVIRNCGLRLIPQDILEEATETIRKTIETGGQDSAAETKKVADAFATINIRPSELEKYLGHPLATISAKELADLRTIYSTIKDGEASWVDYLKEKDAAGKEEGPDDVPMDFKNPEVEQKQSPADEKKTPHDELRGLLEASDIPFSVLIRWGTDSGNIENADTYATLDDIPGSVVTRLLRAKSGLLKGLRQTKGIAV